MKVLDGLKLAELTKKKLAKQFKKAGRFEAFLIGKNPASILYLRKKAEMAESLGVEFHLNKFSETASETKILKQIDAYNLESKVAAIMVQLPLPKKFNTEKIINAVDPSKDVDGLTDVNITSLDILPATAAGILEIIRHYKIKIKNQKIVLIGFTRLLNVPLAAYFAREGAAVVVLKSTTKHFVESKTADVIISAVGRPNLIKAKDVKTGVVMIDAGTTSVNKRLVGDVDFESVATKAAAITPVPGGVGPMTVVSLYLNLAKLIAPK